MSGDTRDPIAELLDLYRLAARSWEANCLHEEMQAETERAALIMDGVRTRLHCMVNPQAVLGLGRAEGRGLGRTVLRERFKPGGEPGERETVEMRDPFYGGDPFYHGQEGSRGDT